MPLIHLFKYHQGNTLQDSQSALKTEREEELFSPDITTDWKAQASYKSLLINAASRS